MRGLSLQAQAAPQGPRAYLDAVHTVVNDWQANGHGLHDRNAVRFSHGGAHVHVHAGQVPWYVLGVHKPKGHHLQTQRRGVTGLLASMVAGVHIGLELGLAHTDNTTQSRLHCLQHITEAARAQSCQQAAATHGAKAAHLAS
jgi:hypothetical protein